VPPEATGYFYTDHHALGREITLALQALRERFPDYVDPRAPMYAGFSQGAIMGALLLPRHPARFARAALVEGGYGLFHEWNIPVAARWKAHEGTRVLLACGRLRCAEQARTSAYYLKRAGVEARVIHVEGAGHTYGGAMHDELRETFAWLIEGDSRFEHADSR
jgi:predicted esterase